MELTIAWQIVNYSRDEVFGGISKAKAYLACVALQIAMFAFYCWFSEVLDDYFLMVCGVITVIGSNMGIVLLARRRNRKGQSMFLSSGKPGIPENRVWNVVEPTRKQYDVCLIVGQPEKIDKNRHLLCYAALRAPFKVSGNNDGKKPWHVPSKVEPTNEQERVLLKPLNCQKKCCDL